MSHIIAALGGVAVGAIVFGAYLLTRVLMIEEKHRGGK